MYQGGSWDGVSKVEGQYDAGRGWPRTVDMLKDAITEYSLSVFEANDCLLIGSILMLVVDVKCLDGIAHHVSNMIC